MTNYYNKSSSRLSNTALVLEERLASSGTHSFKNYVICVHSKAQGAGQKNVVKLCFYCKLALSFKGILAQ